METCPFCLQQLREAVDICPACQRLLNQRAGRQDNNEQEPWYFRKPSIILMLCCIGPLALPLIWWRPDTRLAWKIGLTLIILLASWLLYYVTLETIDGLREIYRFLDSLE